MNTTDITKSDSENEKTPGPKGSGKRRITPRAQRLKHLRDWKESGLSAEAFASASPSSAVLGGDSP